MTSAWECASAAADRAGVTVSVATDFDGASALLQRVWQAQHPAEVASAGLLRTYAHSGNYVAAAFRDGTMLGAAVGFFGRSDDGHPHLHSYVTGVASRSGAGIGFAMKQHQRAWCLDRSVTAVHWTFDPLVARNAYFNLAKLGGSAVDYLPEFYGRMADGINRGDLSDRLYLVWDLTSDRAVRAANGLSVDVDVSGTVQLLRRTSAGLPDLADASGGDSGLPVQTRKLLMAVPSDVEELRRRDPDAASRWRLAVRDVLMPRLAAGWRIDGVTRDGQYVLSEGSSDAPAGS